MDTVRCPMCSKQNPSEAEECEFCGARLKPLIIRQEPGQPPLKQTPPPTPSQPPPDRKQRQETDWLSRIRSDMGEEESVLDAEGENGVLGGGADLLGRLRKFVAPGEEQVPEEGEIFQEEAIIDDQTYKEEIKKPLEEFEELTSSALSEEDSRLLDALAAAEKESKELDADGLVFKESETSGEEESVPDWLARIRARKEEEQAPPPEPEGEADWLAGLRIQAPEAEPSTEIEEPKEGIFPSDFDLARLRQQLPEDEPSNEIKEELEEDLFTSDFDLAGLRRRLTEAEPSDEIEGELLADMFPEDFGLSGKGERVPQEELPSDSKDEFPQDLFSPKIEHAKVHKKGSEEGQATEIKKSLMDDLFPSDFLQTDKAKDKEWLPESLISREKSKEDIDALETEAASVVDDLFADLDIPPEEEEADLGEDIIKKAGKEEFELNETQLEGIEPIFDEQFLTDLGIDAAEWKTAEKIEADQAYGEIGEPEEEIHSLDDLFSDYTKEHDAGTKLAPGSDALVEESELEELEGQEHIPLGVEPFTPEVRKRSSLEEMLDGLKPSWLGDAVHPDDGELPHVPALILDEEAQGIEFAEGGGGEPSSLEIPDWLQNLGSDVEEEHADTGQEELTDLVKATLPSWLEAMRPIETFRTLPKLEPEEEEIVEAAGPLAGLKGILLAEPVMAMPRSPRTAISALDITESDYTQAQVLQKMVEEEQLEEKAALTKRTRLPLLQWACGMLLVLAVTIPPVLGIPSFGRPKLERPDFAPLFEFIQNTPADQPALLIFDYEPANSPEMDAVASGLVTHLARKGQALVTFSTRPFGPLLASRMLQRVGPEFAMQNGVDYLNFGYLAGGTTALQLFITSPKEALIRGFNIPEELKEGGIWESAILSNVQDLSDFALVAVLTGGADSARSWIEQLQTQPTRVPVVMVLGAGIEPLIRPYFEANPPQITGILTGLPTAVRYEMNNGQDGDATRYWDAYGTGVLLVVFFLITGMFYGIAMRVFRPQGMAPD